MLRRVVTIVSAADFRKLLALLDSSVADMKWVLSIFDAGGAGGGIVLSFASDCYFGGFTTKVQIRVANLVAKMAEHCPLAQEDFARENVIRPLVTLLSFDLFMDDPKLKSGKQSIHSIVQINKEMEKKNLYKPGSSSSLSKHYSEGSSKWGNHRKDRENEKPEVKLKLKISCAEALWMLARGSVPNSRRITETKAESNADLRRATFKTNSPAAKAVVDQLLRVIKDSDDPRLQGAAIRAIGSLARTFPARETRVVGPLVEVLGHRNQDVAVEAAVALGKFACPDKFPVRGTL
ncbi:UNVERIFIED_CONTAM: hypothetical protein Sradi_1791600 [Sesamum radiatum]|uniref:DUF7792 domain-containing protein n=1 Tax=Sesamum radiatum TaxID=300843 RepID=A0AAW2TVI7_SESRA